jgi:hypothetical protein
MTPGLEEVLVQLRTAIKLIEQGCPNTAENWAYKAADNLREQNEKRRSEAGEGKEI